MSQPIYYCVCVCLCVVIWIFWILSSPFNVVYVAKNMFLFSVEFIEFLIIMLTKQEAHISSRSSDIFLLSVYLAFALSISSVFISFNSFIVYFAYVLNVAQHKYVHNFSLLLLLLQDFFALFNAQHTICATKPETLKINGSLSTCSKHFSKHIFQNYLDYSIISHTRNTFLFFP